MHPDEFQQAWKTQSERTRISVDSELMLKVIELDQRSFESVSRSGDWSSISVSVLLIPIWIYLGMHTESPWTWYLAIPVFVWSTAFLLYFRFRHYRRVGENAHSMLQCVESSLVDVQDEIWKNRIYVWLNLAPLSFAIVASAAHSAWLRSDGWLDLLDNGSICLFFVAVFGFVFYSHYAARAKLETRRNELLSMQSSLLDEGISDDSQDSIATSVTAILDSKLANYNSPQPSWFPVLQAIASGVALIAGVLVFLAAGRHLDRTFSPSATRDGVQRRGFETKAPYASIRWNGDQPEVLLDDKWYGLLAINETATNDILEFSRSRYKTNWRKRFAEDLVEVLTLMGHPPGGEVALTLQPPGGAEAIVRQGVEMTSENREQIRDSQHLQQQE